jgi:exosome complex component RRP46
VLTSTIIVVPSSGGIIRDPDPQQLLQAGSIHVLAFSSHGDLLVAESEGEFTMDEWDGVYEAASDQCRGSSDGDENDDVHMDTGETGHMEGFVKGILQEKVSRDLRWRPPTR